MVEQALYRKGGIDLDDIYRDRAAADRDVKMAMAMSSMSLTEQRARAGLKHAVVSEARAMLRGILTSTSTSKGPRSRSRAMAHAQTHAHPSLAMPMPRLRFARRKGTRGR